MPNIRAHSMERAWSGWSYGPSGRGPRSFEWLVGSLWIVLLWSWIRPIAELSGWTASDRIIPLFAAAAIYVGADMLRIPSVFGIPLKAGVSLLCVGWLFRESGGHSGYGLDWLQAYIGICAEDAAAVRAGLWENISPENRTIIFLGGWALLAGVIYSLLLYWKRALWLAAATWSYLIVLQLWPGLDTTKELITSGAAGLTLLCVLHVERVKEAYGAGLLRIKQPKAGAAVSNNGQKRGKAAPETVNWVPEGPESGEGASAHSYSMPSTLYAAALFLTFALFVAALAGGGSRGGRMEPLTAGSWERLSEAFGFSEWNPLDEHGLSAAPLGTAKSVAGYGTDDSLLGGPLAIRDEPVFTARTPELTYWRGEAKNYYDGKGWTIRSDEDAAALEGPAGSAYRTVTQELLFQGAKATNIVFGGGTVGKTEALYSSDGRLIPDRALISDPVSGKLRLATGWGELGFARLQVQLPSYEPEKWITAQGDYPESVKRAYLQLPEKLPARVRELASDIAGNAVTPYAKVLLIERYLEEHYRYSLTDVPAAGKNRDFVDAFLFGDAGGYCDYFSTAMAVLLRAEGVPARWVKGYAPGDVQSEGGRSDSDGFYLVNVSSKHAHSWVEAYIPGAGWVAVDPTPGFSGANSKEAEASSLLVETKVQQNSDSGRREGLVMPGLPWSWPNRGELMKAVEDRLAAAGRVFHSLLSRFKFTATGVLLVMLPVLFLSRRKGHLLLLLLLLRSRRRGPGRSASALKLLDRLWLRVFRRYGAPHPGQTLREYAAATGARFPAVREAMYELVLLDEHARYAEGPQPWLPRRRVAGLWNRLFGSRPEKRRGSLPM